jgi:hypothetical protein
MFFSFLDGLCSLHTPFQNAVSKLRSSPRHFLQGPGVAIRVTESCVLDALIVFLDLAHGNTPLYERCTRCGDIRDDRVQAPQRSRRLVTSEQAS